MYTIIEDRDGVTINTNLPEIVIITFTERIVRLKGWVDTMRARAHAKIILNSMAIIAAQRNLSLAFDFEEVWALTNYSAYNN